MSSSVGKDYVPTIINSRPLLARLTIELRTRGTDSGSTNASFWSNGKSDRRSKTDQVLAGDKRRSSGVGVDAVGIQLQFVLRAGLVSWMQSVSPRGGSCENDQTPHALASWCFNFTASNGKKV